MEKTIRQGIVNILKERGDLLAIPLRQRAKFEGWLKFELAYFLEKFGAENVEVESKSFYGKDRTDITFFWQNEPYSIELKTSNTSWKINGVNSNQRPISKNINSIIKDAKKLNKESGIVAFVLFPIPTNDTRWKLYIDRISEKTGLNLSTEKNCTVINMHLVNNYYCDLVVCTFKSKVYHQF